MTVEYQTPKVKVDLSAKRVFVNGEELPWFLHEDGPRIESDSDVAVVYLPVLVWTDDLEVIT
jgi:hypothetical protein